MATTNAIPLVQLIGEQRERLHRLLARTDRAPMPPLKVAELRRKHEALRNLAGERIPRVVHFIKSDARRDHFMFVHYLSIRSASVRIRPSVIKFHCAVEPVGALWERLRRETPELQVVLGTPPTHMGGKQLLMPAHVSDAWRMQILINEGMMRHEL
jgi:hypothetical protein